MSKVLPIAFVEHRTCVTLSRLSLEHLPQDPPIGRRRTFRQGRAIWQPEDRADRMYFIERGEVAIFSGERGHGDLLLQVATVGDPFGEFCFCAEEGGLRRTTAKAETETTVTDVSFADFLRHVQTTPSALRALVTTFCVRLTDCETRSVILAQRGAQERLGLLLLQLARKSHAGTSSRPHAVVLHVSHLDLARMAAMSRAHVTVTLGHFRRQQLIHYDRGRPLTVNVGALATYLAARP